MRPLSESKGIELVNRCKDWFRYTLAQVFEHRAKPCSICETPGACCVDEHFVNVHISRLEAVSINATIDELPDAEAVRSRIDAAIEKYSLSDSGDTYEQRFACPLYDPERQCLIHNASKPLPCIDHACYENASDLPPSSMMIEREERVDDLNTRVYGQPQQWLPLPVAIVRHRPATAAKPADAASRQVS